MLQVRFLLGACIPMSVLSKTRFWRFKRWTANLSLFLISCVLSFLLLEFILDILGYNPHPITKYHSKDLEAGYDIMPDSPASVHRLKEYSYKYWSNELGCFDLAYKGERDYILLLGDSFTWGFAPFEYKYGSLLESYLSRRVLKCGVLGYSTRQELLKAGKLLKRLDSRPSLIIVGYCLGNDWEDYCFPYYRIMDDGLVQACKFSLDTGRCDCYSDAEIRVMSGARYIFWSEGKNLPLLEKIKMVLRRKSTVYRMISANKLVRSIANRLGLAEKTVKSYIPPVHYDQNRYPALRKVFKNNFANLSEFKKLASDHGARLLVVLIPSDIHVYDFLKEENDPGVSGLRRKLTSFLSQQNISYLDLLPYYRQCAAGDSQGDYYGNKGLYLPSDGHWNIRGDRLAALLISLHIVENGLLEVTDKQTVVNKIKQELKAFKAGDGS